MAESSGTPTDLGNISGPNSPERRNTEGNIKSPTGKGWEKLKKK